MAHVFRFYIAPETAPAAEIALSEEEAHHALHVVRVHAGDAVALFDGQGREIDGVVSRIAGRKVVVACNRERRVGAPAARVTLVQAGLLRERSVEFLIQHGTELGLAHFCFFRARHSGKAPRLNPKWQRFAIETCKQCGRAWLPTFEVAPTLEAALASRPDRFLLATNALPPVPVSTAAGRGPVTLIVGPEGDLTREELDLALAHGAAPISLGPATYRSEVAATVAAALVLYELGMLGPKRRLRGLE
jgi:16S rRNA (uracil1498-N3)-methyltransferase